MALLLSEGDALDMEVGDGGLHRYPALAYCFGLEHQAVPDGCIVLSGFVLRTVVGGVAASLGSNHVTSRILPRT